MTWPPEPPPGSGSSCRRAISWTSRKASSKASAPAMARAVYQPSELPITTSDVVVLGCPLGIEQGDQEDQGDALAGRR